MPRMKGFELIHEAKDRYPQLKADQNFRELQAQLEGTENRIAIARRRHIEAINQESCTFTEAALEIRGVVRGLVRRY